jgi:hypothetical protein
VRHISKFKTIHWDHQNAILPFPLLAGYKFEVHGSNPLIELPTMRSMRSMRVVAAPEGRVLRRRCIASWPVKAAGHDHRDHRDHRDHHHQQQQHKEVQADRLRSLVSARQNHNQRQSADDMKGDALAPHTGTSRPKSGRYGMDETSSAKARKRAFLDSSVAAPASPTPSCPSFDMEVLVPPVREFEAAAQNWWPNIGDIIEVRR